MKRLRPPIRPHAVDLNDDETQLRHPLRAVKMREPLRHERPLRTGVNLFDHRVFRLVVKLGRPKNHAVNVGRTVAAFGDEPLGNLPAGLKQFRPIGSLQFDDQTSVRRFAKFGHGSQVHARVGINEKTLVRRKPNLVRAVAFGEDDEVVAVEINAREMDLIRVLARLDPPRETKPAASPRPPDPLGGRPILLW